MSSTQLLAGRVAVVTGGGSGIGRAISIGFAREGARVVIADLNEDAAKETLAKIPDSDRHQAKRLDVSCSDDVKRLFAELPDFGTPDILVNCAGILRDGFLIDLTEAMFDDVINVNLKGTFLMTQAVAKVMIEKKVDNGSIVNISSISGKGGNITQTNYSASKAGVDALTKAVAKELGPHGIRCNSIMPGYIDTPMTSVIPESIKELCVQQISLGRVGQPEEVAEVCIFLASSRSSYMTGSVVQVSGGFFM